MDKEQAEHIKKIFDSYRRAFENFMAETSEIRKKEVPVKLYECMEYSLQAGGKRLRPVLCMAASERCGCSIEDALPMALGFEMLHTATLIHDDLPCMDNDDMRRGKPSNHAMFGETLAVLAGDALLAQSIEYPLVHTKNVPLHKLLKAMQIFSSAIGPAGVCGGQAMDMDENAADGNPDYVRKTAALKTGALIRAAVLSGASLGTDDDKILDCYRNYGTHMGAAFQIVDDILDVTSTAEELGKTPGKDAAQKKINYVTAYGIDKARKLAEDESLSARKALADILPENDFLIGLPDYMTRRTH